jgi:4-hydroxybenzoate polyprenyltransferase
VNFFWLLAMGYALWLGLVLFTGRIRLRGRLVADRDTDPKRFRFYVIGFAAGLLVLIGQAIFPPY